ncbi:MAG: glycosyltransferase [Nitrospinae bacterium]|nr:glycosyltransferase [Nitrospinota bacterium]
MKIHQMLPNFWYGDAIGNTVVEFNRLLRSWGYESDIFADVVHPKLTARDYREYEKEPDGSWLIYHYSTGSPVNWYALEHGRNVILMYHNITPAEFFDGYDREAAQRCQEGRELLGLFAGRVKFAMAGSAYNEDELKTLGFARTAVVPYILDFDRMTDSGNHYYNDGKTNILFVGRVAPNKRHEDLITTFHHYKRHLDPDSRLIMVGGYDPNGLYYRSLKNLAAGLDLSDVIFTGPVADEALGGYFAGASLFLCLSRHEGFCIPLLEAMKFGLPVVALKQTGVAYTMGNSGVTVDRFNPLEVAELMWEVKNDPALKTRVVESQRERFEYFGRQKMTDNFKNTLMSVIGG